MMPPVFLLYIPLLVVLMLNSVSGQNVPPHRVKRPLSTEPFLALAILDSKLSLLTTQQAALQISLNGHTSTSLQSRMKLLKNMDRTTMAIMRRANRLENLCAKKHRQFGVRTFKIIGVKAGAVRRKLTAVKRARGRPGQRAAAKRLDEQIIALIVQFQAVSGGHEATHCRAGEWTCCEPKRAKDLMPGQEVGCRWMCLPRANKCTGLLGLRIPVLAKK